MGDKRGNVTRRVLLGRAAAAGAVSLARPAMGLADALGPRRSLSSTWVGSLVGESPPLLAPGRFALVGVEWGGPAGVPIELRAQALDGRWSPWVTASLLGHDSDRGPRGSDLFGEPVWTGPADRVQLRSGGAVHGLRLHFVSAPARSPARAAAFPAAAPVLETGPGQPPIIARRAWGQGQARPGHTPEYGTVKVAFVHHTVNPNGYSAGEVPSLLLAIFDYHRFVRGFWDIAYNFVIDSFGRIWEGRAGGIDMPVIGAHAGAYNAESTGVAILGDFINVVPSPAALRALQHVLAWKMSLHGLPTQGRATVVVDPASAFYTPFAPGAHVSLPRIAGHRDGDLTDCPGDALYRRLPSIRPRVTALAATPARLRVMPRLKAATAGVPVTASGLLSLLDGTPFAAAPIELQQLQINGLTAAAITIATTTTAADGTWSIPLTLVQNTTLRALHRPAPAAVDDWMAVAVSPAITLTVTSAAPLLVTGTISPAKPHVTVDLYPAGRTTGKPLAKKRAPAGQGTFTAAVPMPAPGDYVLVARSAADERSAAGASAPLPVTVS